MPGQTDLRQAVADAREAETFLRAAALNILRARQSLSKAIENATGPDGSDAMVTNATTQRDELAEPYRLCRLADAVMALTAYHVETQL